MQIFGWKPDYYDSEYLPEEMPSDLLDYIATLERDEVRTAYHFTNYTFLFAFYVVFAIGNVNLRLACKAMVENAPRIIAKTVYHRHRDHYTPCQLFIRDIETELRWY